MYESKRVRILSVASVLGTLFALALLGGLALAQEPGEPEEVGYWLVLDSAKEVDEVLPPLLSTLSEFEAEGQIEAFDPEPQRSDPQAVPCVRVIAAPEMYDVLRRLPGVLDAVEKLPPPPPTAGDIRLLAVSGEITGMVTDESNGQPIAGGGVWVYDAVSFAQLDDVGTDANGQYTVTVTAPYSQAKVYAEPLGYRPEWYDDKPYFSGADAVALQAGGVVSGVNLALEPAGAISVTLTLDGGGPAPAGVWVRTHEVDTGYWIGTCSTDSTGHCVTADLVSGTYKLYFTNPWSVTGPVIVPEWYEDEESQDAATPVAVTSRMTTAVAAQVTANGLLSGTVTDESSGAKLGGIVVSVYDAQGNYAGSDWTSDGSGFPWPDPVGQYQIWLAPGTYRIRFEDEIGVLYQSEWYSDAASMSAADWVTITGGVTTTANAALTTITPTGLITGHITKFGGNPLAGGIFGGEEVAIDLYDAATGHEVGRALKFEGDGSTTLYTATVPVGEYKVHFSPWFYASSEWYSDTNAISAATVITVTDGGVVTDVNADLDPYVEPATGCITGTLTSNGAPVSGTVEVHAYRPGDTLSSGAAGTATGSGVYRLCGLEPGDYEVSFSKFPSATTWYSDTLFRSGATTVSVTANITTPNVDGSLDDLGACVSGTVVDVGGEPVPDASVYVHDPDGSQIYVWLGLWGAGFAPRAYTDGDGGFVACGLQPGTYTLCGYRYDWTMDAEMDGCSDPIVIVAGEGNDAGDIVIGRHLYLPLVIRNSS